MGNAWHRCVLLIVDIEGFGSPTHNDLVQVLLRQRLYRLVQRALEAVGVESAQVLAFRDLGDGVLVVLGQTVSPDRLVEQGVPELAAGIAHDNRTASPAARLRLRVAVHQGPLVEDAHGYTGQTLTHAFRLLEAEVVRTVLRAAREAGLVVVVSDQVHQRLLAGGRAVPEFQPVWLAHKETTARAWLHLAGVRMQPRLPRLLQAAGTSTAATASLAGEDALRRRELLALSGTLMGSATLELLVGERRVSLADGLVAQRVAGRLHRLAESMPARPIAGALDRHARAVDRLARRAEGPEERAALLRALIHTQAYGGFVAAFDLGDQRKAQARFRVALLAAEQLGDPVLTGLVCFRMSAAARSSDRFAEALQLALAGAALVDRADPALAAALHLAVAHAHDRMGQATEALHALDAGRVLLAGPALPASPWTRVDAARFAGGRGTVEAGLGRLDEAGMSLQTNIDAYPPGNGHRGLMLTYLAKVRFAQDAPELAARLAAEALRVAQTLGSRSRLAALCMLRRDLRRYRHLTAVRELADRLRLATPATGPVASGQAEPAGQPPPPARRADPGRVKRARVSW
jgi:tetratricopeptide (TPR) repeat protein